MEPDSKWKMLIHLSNMIENSVECIELLRKLPKRNTCKISLERLWSFAEGGGGGEGGDIWSYATFGLAGNWSSVFRFEKTDVIFWSH